jgi:simple sugar transport system ATP-binding protein
MRARAKDALDRLDVKVDVSRPLEEYSTAVRQLVAIARAVDRSAKVLVLDEPTSSLDRDEVARLFALVKRLKGEGMAIVFVTHFLDQVYAVADSVTVLRNGRKVGDWPTADLSRRALVAHMLGRELEDVPHAEARPPTGEEALLSVEGLGRSGTLRPATFRIQAGETVGLAGLLGSGRTETMRLVFGATPADCGSVVISGRRVRPRSPRAAIRMGMGFCPEDRKADGVCPGLSVAENLLLVVQARRGWHRPLGLKKARAMVAEHVEKLQIKARDAGAAIETLSGGNQQKVLLARWLAADPELLLLDEPTRGIDVGSKFEVRKLIVELAKRGMSFLFSSAELEEVVHTCDRVVVLRDRAIVGEVSGPGLDEQTVMAMIAEGDA